MPFKAIGGGYVNIPAAGTPVRLTVNLAAPAAKISCHTIFIQQVQANTGKLYLMDRSSGVAATGVGVLVIIPAPTLVAGVGTLLPWVAVTIPNVAAGLNAADYYLDADNNGMDALVSAITL